MKLTEKQAQWARGQVGRWLAVKERETGEKATPADADHSALLFRLLRGRDPLPKPPQLLHAYPDYPDWPYEDEAEPPGVVLSEQRDAEKRLRAWLDGVQLSNRLGYPVYANPAELKADLRALLDRKGEG